eukprot:UN11251
MTNEDKKTGIFIKRIDFRKHHAGEMTKSDYEQTIKRKKGRRQRNDAQMYGNMFDNLWTERIDIMTGKDSVQHKMGPREIGKIRGWKGYKYNEADDGGFLADKSTSRKKDYSKVEKVTKSGPRDIGTAHGWRGYKYE